MIGLGEKEHKLNAGSKHKGSNKENLKSKVGGDNRCRISGPLDKRHTVCKRVLSGLLESLHKNQVQHVALCNNSDGADPVQNTRLTVFSVILCRYVCSKMRVLDVPRSLASLLCWLTGSKPRTAS